MARQPIILIHADAPAKPAVGAACNGCGLCCLYAPCPLGMLVSRKRRGACHALRWQPHERRYRCGLLAAPGLSGRVGVRAALHRWRLVLLRRWIAAGVGCDADLAIVDTRPSAP